MLNMPAADWNVLGTIDILKVGHKVEAAPAAL
jgi:hypothetical protein